MIHFLLENILSKIVSIFYTYVLRSSCRALWRGATGPQVDHSRSSSRERGGRPSRRRSPFAGVLPLARIWSGQNRVRERAGDAVSGAARAVESSLKSLVEGAPATVKVLGHSCNVRVPLPPSLDRLAGATGKQLLQVMTEGVAVEREGGKEGKGSKLKAHHKMLSCKGSRILLMSQVWVERGEGILLRDYFISQVTLPCFTVVMSPQTDGRRAGGRSTVRGLSVHWPRAALPPSPSDGPTHGQTDGRGRNLCFG